MRQWKIADLRPIREFSGSLTLDDTQDSQLLITRQEKRPRLQLNSLQNAIADCAKKEAKAHKMCLGLK